MLAGCRRSETLALLWQDVDLERDKLRLRDAETADHAVPRSPTARQVLISLSRRPGHLWVIFGRESGMRLVNLNASWLVVHMQLRYY